MITSSRYIQEAADQLATLPGVGKKTALRLALFLLKKSEEDIRLFSASFVEMKQHIKYCKECHNISDNETCNICLNHNRDARTLCIVEDMRDVMAIENTSQFSGKYHVLGGIISPIDGIGPTDLNISSLVEKVAGGHITEVILALSTTMEGDTTNFYINKKLSPYDIKISIIARGVAVGGELEYTDEITLGSSILNRTLYNKAPKDE